MSVTNLFELPATITVKVRTLLQCKDLGGTYGNVSFYALETDDYNVIWNQDESGAPFNSGLAFLTKTGIVYLPNESAEVTLVAYLNGVEYSASVTLGGETGVSTFTIAK